VGGAGRRGAARAAGGGLWAEAPGGGRDLRPLLEGRPTEPRALYTEQFEYFPVRAVRTSEWILEQRGARRQRIATAERKLYRRTASGFPREPAPPNPTVSARLNASLNAVLHPPTRHPSEKLVVPEDIRAQLRALGYTDEATGP